MKNGPARFFFYLQKTEQLMHESGNMKDPARWLFLNQARTPFFMLESLSRLYSKILDSKELDRLSEHFKLVEDGLGQIDYYNSLSLAFAENKKIQPECKEYFERMTSQKASQTNDLLLNNGWIQSENRRIKKIIKRLKRVDWLSPKREVEAIGQFYRRSIDSICRFAEKTGYSFDNVEEDIHELRRKLRWLSIYPQALQGVVQFAPAGGVTEIMKKYLTEEIISSPFNRLPDTGKNTVFLLLDKNSFLALSWMIAKLGALKDEGLQVTGLCEALQEIKGCSADEALKNAFSILGKKQSGINVILDEASSLTKTFFREGIMLNLIAGIARPV